MNLQALSTTEIGIIIAVAVIVVGAIALLLVLRKRRTRRLRAQFGGAEYERALAAGGSQRKGEAGLEARAERVDALHIRPLAAGDRARFAGLWLKIQARFVDGPGGAVMEADQLLRDVMSARGYPTTAFEQQAADVSVDHPMAIENFRKGHEIALRQSHGQATTEDLRQAMIHYRTLFEDLVGQPELAHA
jgi:hypothetical protein